MATTGSSSDLRQPFLRTRGLVITALCLIAFAFLLGQSLSFTDFVGGLGDWQFARFGRYFPALTILLLTLVVLLICLICVRFGRYLRQRSGVLMADDSQRTILLADASRLLFTLAALAGLATLTVFGHYLQLPDNSGKQQVISLQTNSVSAWREGPAKLIDAPGIGPIARYAEGLIFTQRTSFFMPVARAKTAGSAAGIEGPYNLFVEINSPPGRSDEVSLERLARVETNEHHGHLRKGGLRPEIVQMYRAAGHPVESRSTVLYRSTASANFGTLVFMVELLGFGIIAVIFAFALRRAEQRIRRDVTGKR